MDVTTEAARALSDEALHAALAQVNLSIQHLEEHAKGRDNPAQWYEPSVGEAILEGLYRRRRWREELKLELARRSAQPLAKQAYGDRALDVGSLQESLDRLSDEAPLDGRGGESGA